FLAGADFRMGRESRAETGESLAPEQPDRLMMGVSVQWYAEHERKPSSFPLCPWAVQFTEETAGKPLTRGEWDWETGMNLDSVTDIEKIRDHALRAVFGYWSFMKNKSSRKDQFANWRLAWVAYIGGKRESRRLLGDVILTQQDIEEQRPYPDASVTTTWPIDLHYPHPENSKHFPGQEFRSIAKTKGIKPYPIPYRCLYSRNIENLMMAGRNISVTHVALGTIRVQRTTGMMGEVLGMAASLCAKHATTPRGVFERHLDELKSLMERGVGKESLK
ncbi:MAG: FAD-dependent oxidoreductase, partial [Candidatus Sumerlaeia bacterium]|nr:FAD-dependent oxidoreductase [Candidatus Sumerlaeia bacterium]